MKAPLVDFGRLGEEYGRIGAFMANLPGILDLRRDVASRVARSPRRELYREHSVGVYAYEDAGARLRIPLLVVPSLVNRPSIMDMLPGESFIEAMRERGVRVYMIEWGEPNPAQQDLTLEDYVRGYLGRAVRRVLRDSGADRVGLAGYCLGGTFATLHAALDGGRNVAHLVTMVSPVGFMDMGLLSWWARPEHFDPDRVVKAFGNVPGRFFSSVFPWLVPTSGFRKLRTLYDNQDDRPFLESFLAVDHWISDNVPFPGGVYREVIRHGYQENVLVKDGAWPLRSGPARLKDLTMPLMNLSARFDHVAPCGSCEVLSELVGSDDVTTRVYETGHLGLALGKDKAGAATTRYWDEIGAWLADHEPGKVTR